LPSRDREDLYAARQLAANRHDIAVVTISQLTSIDEQQVVIIIAGIHEELLG
jgi:hypothetical protein